MTKPLAKLSDKESRRRLPPGGGGDHYYTGRDRQRLRYGLWLPEQVTGGTVFILPGRGEFIEKYFETIADLRERNLNGDGTKNQEVVRGVADYFVGGEGQQIDLGDPRRHAVAPPLPDALPDRGPRRPDMTGGKQRLAGAPADVVDIEPDRHGICLDRCPSARQADQRLGSIATDIEPPAVS